MKVGRKSSSRLNMGLTTANLEHSVNEGYTTANKSHLKSTRDV